MKIDFKLDGSFEKKLNELRQNANAIGGTNEVDLNELFNTSFMSKNTSFSDFSEFANSSPFDFSVLESIDENELNEYVSSKSKFNTWQEMLNEAATLWVGKQLGL